MIENNIYSTPQIFDKFRMIFSYVRELVLKCKKPVDKILYPGVFVHWWENFDWDEVEDQDLRENLETFYDNFITELRAIKEEIHFEQEIEVDYDSWDPYH